LHYLGRDMPRKKTDTPVAVVTGGARGIGLAIAEWFLADGRRVALLDIDGKELARTGREHRQHRVDLGAACEHVAGRLRHQQGRADF